MRQGKFGKPPNKIRRGNNGCIQTIGTSDDKTDIFAQLLPVLHLCSQLLSTDLLTMFIEYNAIVLTAGFQNPLESEAEYGSRDRGTTS